MSERDRQNPYERDQQFGSGNRGGGGQGSGYGSGQAHQWQSGDNRQQGGYWQQSGEQRGGSDDYARDYRFSGQGYSHDDAQGYGRGDGQSYGQGQRGYRSQLSDDDLRNDQREASRNYERSRAGYGQHNDRGQQDWRRDSGRSRYGQGSDTAGYGARDYDASGGNDFGNFTSEDFGGRDFYNRGGGAMGGMRSSESYRPSYGLSSWLKGDDDRQGASGRSSGGRGSSREDYGSWRQYGESRGFLQRAGDEVASWFGDEDASRRREQDHRHDERADAHRGQSHRGRGPANYTRSDERIRDDANDHLTHDHHVDASHITVNVKDGELTLDGTVDSREAKRRAEDCVERISGVKHVQNNLRVQDHSATASSYGQSGSTSTGTTYGQSSGSGLTGSGSALGGSTSTANSSTGLGASSTTASSGSGVSGQTGASTTSGIGSAAPAGVGSASAPRSSDKTS